MERKMLMVVGKGQLVYIHKIAMAVGVKIHQYKFTHNRGSNLLYALAVEDSVGSSAFAVSKVNDREKPIGCSDLKAIPRRIRVHWLMVLS